MQSTKQTMKEKRRRKKKTLKDGKLETLKELRVILHDIAHLVPPHQKRLFGEWNKKIEEPCINVSTNSSSNVQLKQDMKMKIDAVKSTKSRKRKASSEDVDKMKNPEKCNIVETRLNAKDIKPKETVQEVKNISGDCQCNEISPPSVVTQKLGLIDSCNRSSSNAKDTSNLLESPAPTTVVPTCTITQYGRKQAVRKTRSNSGQNLQVSSKLDVTCGRKQAIRKTRLNSGQNLQDLSKSDVTCGTGLLKVGSDDTNSLDKKTLTFLDCNSKIQEISSTFVVHSQCDNGPSSVNFTNGTDHKVKQKQCKKQGRNKIGTSNVTNANLENNICINKTFDNIETDVKSEESCSSDWFCQLTIDKSNMQQDEQDMRKISNNETVSLLMNNEAQTSKLETLEAAVNNSQRNISGPFSGVSKPVYSTRLRTNCVTGTPAKLPKISSTFAVHSQCDNGPSSVDFINRTDHKVKQKQHKKQGRNKIGTSNVTNANLENNICINKTLDNIETDVKSEESCSSDWFCQLTNDKSNTQQDEQDIRKISNNETVSLLMNNEAQTSKLETLEAAVNNSQRNTSGPFSGVSKPVYSTRLRTNCVTGIPAKLPKTYNKNKSTVKTQNLPKITQDCFLPKGTIKIIREKRTDVSLENDSKHVLPKQSKYNDNDKNIEKISHVDEVSNPISVFTKEKNGHVSSNINEINNVTKISDCTLMINNNGFILKDKNMLDNEFHDDTIANESSESLTCCKKRTTEENAELNLVEHKNNKRIKLDRRTWLQNNVTSTKSVNPQQSNDIQNINTTTIKSNIIAKNVGNHEDCQDVQSYEKLEKIVDLRECINRKRHTNLSILKIVSENNNNAESEERDVNDINGSNITKNEEISNKFSSEETPGINRILCGKKNNIQINPVHDNDLHLVNNSQNALEEMGHVNKTDNQIDPTTSKDANIQKKYIEDVNDDDDDDYISLFTEETFDITLYEDTSLHEVEKPQKCSRSETPYIMSTNSIDKYITQNTYEFNKVYAECMENKIEKLNEPKGTKELFNKHQEQPSCADNISMVSTKLASPMPENIGVLLKERKKIFDKQQEQTSHADNVFVNTTKLASPVTKNAIILPKETKGVFNRQQERISHAGHIPVTATKLLPMVDDMDSLFPDWIYKRYFYGYCFMILRYHSCRRQNCPFNHNLQQLIEMASLQSSDIISMIIKSALSQKYIRFSQEVYLASLRKLNINQILTTYKMLHDTCYVTHKVIHSIIKELIQRKVSLKNIVNDLTIFMPNKNPLNLKNILQCVEVYIKPGEYWDTVKTIILISQPDKNIIEKTLHDCINSEILSNIQDINTTLINKLDTNTISTLDKSLIARFKNLLGTLMKDSTPIMPIQNFGENLIVTETIASPDSRQSSSPVKSLQEYNITSRIDANEIKRHVVQEKNGTNNVPYRLQPIDNLPVDNLMFARSFYKDHKNLWKFYVDLERFMKGLQHEDYDYVIEILENYAEKKDESTIFIRSCCSILRTEIKRSEYHLTNVIRRTVQTGTSGIVGKILFNIGLDILARLVDEEAWGLALWFLPSLNIYNSYSSHNAGFILLSAEIYLANKKIIKALNLLKNKNIIHTSRTKWYVKSTVNDEHVRNKIMYILMDALCIDFIEHAFFLFQFLLRNQSSQYYPIDLSRYVDKLIILILSKDDTNLITEMGNLILKYNFAPNTTTSRALISALIHVDKNLAKQLYNYAEAIGIYTATAIKLWPVTQIIINTDLTEEEIYLVFLQLLDKLIMNFGHTIEFIRYISVYLILEVRGNEQFYYAEQSYYNNQAVANITKLIRTILKKRFDPPITLVVKRKGRICKLQSKSLINYLKSEHCS